MKLETHLVVKNKLGLHARAANKLVNLSAKYQSTLVIQKGGKEYDCKSIMSLLMLAATQGTELTLSAQGPDADAALTSVTGLFDDYFGEGG